ncbi:WD40 repeat-like protein [Rhizopogon salebrosus TDB-379]|nr:WD40 repeat-like protein [Rhizopogon salebrosus TDB-379]
MESSAALPAARVRKTQAIIPHRKFEGHTGGVTNVLHLRGGERMMTCSWDGSLRVWDVERGKQIGEDWRDQGAGMNTIALSPDGKKVLSGSNDDAVRLWDNDTAKIIARWMGQTAGVTSLCWSRDGRRAVSGAYDARVRVWDAETGKSTILELLEFDRVMAAIYSPDERMIAAGGWRNKNIGFIQIFDANTGKLVKNLGFTARVYCVAWPGDGKTFISGSDDHEIRIWNTTTWQQIAVLTGHTSAVHDIAVSPNGRILASASWDHTARLWNIENGQPISSPLQHAENVHCLSFSADGNILATGCWDHNAYTWDVSAIFREAGLEELLSNPHDVGHSMPILHDVRSSDSRMLINHPQGSLTTPDNPAI